MAKHNGKARKAGERVGHALANRHKGIKRDYKEGMTQHRHTTDLTQQPQKNMQSVLERNDLAELMAMADLADKDFSAERGEAVVISTGSAVDALAQERDAAARLESEARNAHRLCLPRRPAWTPDTTPEQLDLQERDSFLTWRRTLARLEEEEGLVLTPFEKNLEVWRQLWRVLERSDIVVQVVDARDPLLYRTPDLEAYAREVHPTKAPLVLLNKADLLPPAIRSMWADYFDKAGVDYAFWSAFAASEAQSKLRSEASALGVDAAALKAVMAAQEQAKQEQQQQQRKEGQSPWMVEPEVVDPRTCILDEDELLEFFEERARAAIEAAGPDDIRYGDTERRCMVGLVGYPNVGKSSTINALFGSKKTAVAPTPGKTKHFQTLNVSGTLCLCDCPGLVMPKFARSKAEMVAAGVIPIDRLSAIRAPMDVVVARVGRGQLSQVYGLRLPPAAAHMHADSAPTADQVLRAYATLRGWTAGSGLPDETRAGRQLLRDYTTGKLLYCQLPPGAAAQEGWAPAGNPATSACNIRLAAPALPQPKAFSSSGAAAPAQAAAQQAPAEGDASPAAPDEQASLPTAASSNDWSALAATASNSSPASTAGPRSAPVASSLVATTSQSAAAADTSNAQIEYVVASPPLDEADLELLESLQPGVQSKLKRPDYKFQKKQARSKGTRGEQRAEGLFDGAALVTGKKGGLVRVGGYH